MNVKAWIATGAAIILLPASALIGVAVITATTAAATTATAAAATAVCTYAYPDADRIIATMKTLTDEPVQVDQWNRYASQIGIDPKIVTWETSTSEQRTQLLNTTIRNTLYTTTPAAVTTPALIWWYGSVPDDTNTTWQNTSIPGWNGTLETYLTTLTERYATNPNNNWDNHQCIPPYATNCAQPTNQAAILATIRHIESGDNYTNATNSVANKGRNKGGNPTGAYQFLYTTWNHYNDYNEAFLAPPTIQDNRATQDVNAILTQFGGDPAWVPIAWYVGIGGAQKVANGTWSLAYIPNPQYNTLSIGEYQARWLNHYTTIALPATGTQPTQCPQGAAAAITWAETQIGAPYAAIDPYRFGTPPWPGGSLTGSRGDRYTFPTGTIVYDCSGFVIAAWRKAGIDLVAQYGLYGSQAFATSPLQEIPPNAIAPGDLAVYKPKNGVGHIVMIHHLEPDGTVKTIEATASHGVTIATLKWDRVTSIKRPASDKRETASTSMHQDLHDHQLAN